MITACAETSEHPTELGAAELTFLIPLGPQSGEYFEQANVLVDEEVQRRTAACMVAAGFEYVPKQLDFGSAGTVDWTSASLEYATDYGFAQADRYVHADQSLAVDPNQPYIDSLNSAGREAYWGALMGDRDTSGCARSSSQEVREELGIQEALAAGNEILETADASERVREAETVWAECMRSRGFEFDTHAAMASYIGQALNSATGSPDQPPGSADPVAAFRKYEVELAIANHHCGVEYRQERNLAIAEALRSVDDQYRRAADVLAEES